MALVFPVLVLESWAPDFDFMLTRIWIFGHLVLLGSVFLRAVLPGYADLGIVAITALSYALVERVALYIPDISTQMTSMGWSEASRYYYASLFFSESIYGVGCTVIQPASLKIPAPIHTIYHPRIADMDSSRLAGVPMVGTCHSWVVCSLFDD